MSNEYKYSIESQPECISIIKPRKGNKKLKQTLNMCAKIVIFNDKLSTLVNFHKQKVIGTKKNIVTVGGHK